MVVFSDFECPYCERAITSLMPVLEKNKKDVALYYKHFPLSFHRAAVPMAKAYEAAKAVGLKWDIYAMKPVGESESEMIGWYASQIKSDKDRERFLRVANDPSTQQKIDGGIAEGMRIGVDGTPFIVVNGRVMRGLTPEGLQSIIDGVKK